MKFNTLGINIVLMILGLLIFAAGLILLWLLPEASGVFSVLPESTFKALPFICMSVGIGIFCGNLGAALARRNPQALRQSEIEQKDERNQALANKAKAKAFSMMLYTMAALVLAFALMGVEAYVVITLVVVYLFFIGTMIYFLNKYHKEM